jgi:hypothetical protein
LVRSSETSSSQNSYCQTHSLTHSLFLPSFITFLHQAFGAFVRDFKFADLVTQNQKKAAAEKEKRLAAREQREYEKAMGLPMGGGASQMAAKQGGGGGGGMAQKKKKHSVVQSNSNRGGNFGDAGGNGVAVKKRGARKSVMAMKMETASGQKSVAVPKGAGAPLGISLDIADKASATITARGVVITAVKPGSACLGFLAAQVGVVTLSR